MAKSKRRDPAKEKFWRRMLRLWRHSGATVRDFCGQHRLSESCFYAWRREMARRDQERTIPARKARRPAPPRASGAATLPAFVKLPVGNDAAVPAAIEVVVADRRVLRVRPGFDPDLLRQLLRLLEEPTC